MVWMCRICGEEHGDVPNCFGMEAPWRSLVPEADFEARVQLTSDQCVVDEKIFFIRGHINIPIHGLEKGLSFSVWSSLSEQSFVHMGDRWNAPDRGLDEPYFGWLSNSIPVYPDTLNLKLSVQSREPGLTPIFTVERTDHQLSLDQENGISVQRWHEIAHELMHPRIH